MYKFTIEKREAFYDEPGTEYVVHVENGDLEFPFWRCSRNLKKLQNSIIEDYGKQGIVIVRKF